MTAPIAVDVTTGSFLSGDGTRIGYRQMGKGPGLVLLHGALQSSRSFTSLGAALSDAFTIYIPDRRGRGLSGPFTDNHSMRTETEDLEALLDKTGSQISSERGSHAFRCIQEAVIRSGVLTPEVVSESRREE